MQGKLRAALWAGALGLAGGTACAEPITLEQAVARALDGAPTVGAAEAGIAAARGARMQAGTRPNPSIAIEGENFAGTGSYDVLRQSELTLTYSQPLERGGKRDARIALAEREIETSQATARVTRLNFAASVQRAYIDVLITREALRIADEAVSLEQEIEREALRRVRGYKDPLFVETRAKARLAQARLALAEAQARYARARGLLGSYIGMAADAVEVTGPILQATPPASTPASTPAGADAALDQATVSRARAAVVVEQAQRTQDYTVSGGARYLRGTGDVALVAGITIPLGRFDRNQGNIARAQAERQRLELEAEANRLERLRRLAALGADADAARARADGIIAVVFPATVKTLEQVREGYGRGGFSFGDVQDAAEALLDVQQQWVEAMTRYRDLQSEIDRLQGRFDVLPGEEQMP